MADIRIVKLYRFYRYNVYQYLSNLAYRIWGIIIPFYQLESMANLVMLLMSQISINHQVMPRGFAQVAEAKRQSEELLALANREAMRAKDGLGRAWRLYQSRSQSPWGENCGKMLERMNKYLGLKRL